MLCSRMCHFADFVSRITLTDFLGMDRAQAGPMVGGIEKVDEVGVGDVEVSTYDCLGGGADDSGTSCGTDGDIQAPIRPFNDNRRNRRKRSFAGTDVVRRGRLEAEFVGDAGDGEVVHLVVSARTYD